MLPIKDTGSQIEIPSNFANATTLDMVDENAKPLVNEADDITPIKSRHTGPVLWSVAQKWILALPVTTEKERERRKLLQKELERIVSELDDETGLGEGGVSAPPN